MMAREWPLVAVLLAIAAAMMANPGGVLRAIERVMDAQFYALERLREQLRGSGWHPWALRAERWESSPRAERRLRIAGACLAAATILAALGSA